jgi:hypothetical protein
MKEIVFHSWRSWRVCGLGVILPTLKVKPERLRKKGGNGVSFAFGRFAFDCNDALES